MTANRNNEIEKIYLNDLASELGMKPIELLRVRKERGSVKKVTILDRYEAEEIRRHFKNTIKTKTAEVEEAESSLNISIQELYISNFKLYDQLSFFSNRVFNMVVGENNIGKSTVFDAILLWEIAYKKLITSKSTFYKASTTHKITTLDLVPFRIIDIGDIFKNQETPCYIEIKFITPESKQVFNLKIKFVKPSDHNSYILADINDSYDGLSSFYEFLKKKRLNIREAFSITLIKPIANIVRHEYFYNDAQVSNKSNTGYSFEVLRNKILETSVSRKFTYLEQKLYNVLGKKFKIRWKNINRDNDVNIRLTIQEENEKEIDISLIGSGVLNLLEIFSALYNRNNGANLLLLDEPDSHIHSDIQPRLISQLRQTTNSSQIFVITHNDRLILTVNKNELFYLSKQSKNSHILKPYSLDSDNIYLLRKQMSGSIYKLEMSYNKRPILFVEGVTDKKIISEIINISFSKYSNKIDIRYKNGHNWVKDQIISWHYGKLPNRAAALFDYDTDATSSIKTIEEAIPVGNKGEKEKRNFKLFSLKKYPPDHIKEYYRCSVKTSYSIEEMFGMDIWEYFKSEGMLEQKKDIHKYNDSLDFSTSLNQYFEQCGIKESKQLYFYKVKQEKKMKACNYIISKLTQTNTDTIDSLVQNILSYLLDTKVDKHPTFTDTSCPVPEINTCSIPEVPSSKLIRGSNFSKNNSLEKEHVLVECPSCKVTDVYLIGKRLGSCELPKCKSCGKKFHLNRKKDGVFTKSYFNAKKVQQKKILTSNNIEEQVNCPFCSKTNTKKLGKDQNSTSWCTCFHCKEKFPMHRKKDGSVFINADYRSKKYKANK